MSLDFDRSPDGEPVGETQVPAQQAPATADEERSPSFTPKHAAGEFAGDEFAGDEPTARRPVVPGSVVGEPETAAAEPVLADPAEADEPVAAEAAPAAATASEATAYHSGVTPAWDAEGAGGTDAATAGRAAGTTPAA